MTHELYSVRFLQKKIRKERPFYVDSIFYLYLFLLFIPGKAYVGDGISLSIVLVPVVIFAYIFRARLFLMNMLPAARTTILVLISVVVVYVFWALLTGGVASDYIRVFRPIYGHIEGFALILGIFAISSSPIRQKNMLFLITSMFCVVLLLSLTLGRVDTFGDRQPGFFKHPNQLGIVMSMFLVYFTACAMANSYRSLTYNGMVLLSVFALFASGSKTNILMSVPFIALSIVYRARSIPDMRRALKFMTMNYVFIAALVMVSAIVLVTVNPRAGSALSEILGGQEAVGDYRTIQDRQAIWDESLSEFEYSPLTGIGAGQPLPDGTEHSHNIFIDSLRTVGAPGFALILIFFIVVVGYVVSSLSWMRQTWAFPSGRLRNDVAKGQFIGATLAMATYLMTNQLSDSFGPSTLPFFYLFLGISSSLLSVGPTSYPLRNPNLQGPAGADSTHLQPPREILSCRRMRGPRLPSRSSRAEAL